MEYLAAAYTDIGVCKETNQDSICVRRAAVPGQGEIVLAVVCDGMGGLKKGELASAAVVNAFGMWFDRHLLELPLLCGADLSQVRSQWTDLIVCAHQAMLRYSAAYRVQLGTTVSAFLACGGRYLTLTVGDSRIYERRDHLCQLTQDQSLVAREIAAGRITEAEGRHHPQRNVLLQCIGAGGQILPVFTEGRVRAGALYLLCSDGLVHELTPAELEERFRPASLTAKAAMTAALQSAVELCKTRGETDNITAILLRADESRYTPAVRPRMEKLHRLLSRRASTPVVSTEIMLLETAQIVHTQETLE